MVNSVKKTAYIAAAMLLLGMAVGPRVTYAQCEQTVDLLGRVVDDDTGLPIEDVLVCVEEYCNPPCQKGILFCTLCIKTNSSGEFHIHRKCDVGLSNPYSRWFYLHLSKEGYTSTDIDRGSSYPQQYCYYPEGTDSIAVDFQDIRLEKSSSAVLDVHDGIIPSTFELRQNYPNPFNRGTIISFSLPAPAQVEVVIYDILGQVKRTTDLGYCSAGPHAVEFAAMDADNRPWPSGMYFYRVTADGAAQTRRMVFMK